jgi:hypothetical protein
MRQRAGRQRIPVFVIKRFECLKIWGVDLVFSGIIGEEHSGDDKREERKETSQPS